MSIPGSPSLVGQLGITRVQDSFSWVLPSPSTHRSLMMNLSFTLPRNHQHHGGCHARGHLRAQCGAVFVPCDGTRKGAHALYKSRSPRSGPEQPTRRPAWRLPSRTESASQGLPVHFPNSSLQVLPRRSGSAAPRLTSKNRTSEGFLASHRHTQGEQPYHLQKQCARGHRDNVLNFNDAGSSRPCTTILLRSSGWFPAHLLDSLLNGPRFKLAFDLLAKSNSSCLAAWTPFGSSSTPVFWSRPYLSEIDIRGVIVHVRRDTMAFRGLLWSSARGLELYSTWPSKLESTFPWASMLHNFRIPWAIRV